MSNTGSIATASTASISAISAAQRLQKNAPPKADAVSTHPVFTRASANSPPKDEKFELGTTTAALMRPVHRTNELREKLDTDCKALLSKMSEGKVNDVRFKHDGKKAVVHFDPKDLRAVSVKTSSPTTLLTLTADAGMLYNGRVARFLKDDELKAANRLVKSAIGAVDIASHR